MKYNVSAGSAFLDFYFACFQIYHQRVCFHFSKYQLAIYFFKIIEANHSNFNFINIVTFSKICYGV